MRLGLTHHNTLEYKRAQELTTKVSDCGAGRILGPKQHPDPADRPLRMIWGLAARDEEPTFDYISDLFSGLVEETPDLAIVPDVAYQWEILNDGRTYVFHLRDDVFWSDGEPVTAHDFVFAWQHNRLPDQAAGEALYNVKGGRMIDYGITADLQQVDVEIPDPYTLVVTLPQPAAYFLHLLSHPLAAPKPRHVVERHGDDLGHRRKYRLQRAIFTRGGIPMPAKCILCATPTIMVAPMEINARGGALFPATDRLATPLTLYEQDLIELCQC